MLKSPFTQDLQAPKPKAPKTREAAFYNLQRNFENLTADAVLNRSNKTTSLLYDSAPETSAALDGVAVRAVEFLASKLPRKSAPVGMLELLNRPRPPSDHELAKFERYLKAVEQPTSVLQDLETGQLSREGVEALHTVYPAMYTELRNYVVEKLQSEPTELSYNKKLQLGLLLDITVDVSMLPQNVVALQSSFSAADNAPAAPKSVKLSKSSTLETDTQDKDTLS